MNCFTTDTPERCSSARAMGSAIRRRGTGAMPVGRPPLGRLGRGFLSLMVRLLVEFIGFEKKVPISKDYLISWRREWDSNPRYGCPYTRFPSVRLQPLGHPSLSQE